MSKMEATIEGYKFKLLSDVLIGVYDSDEEDALPSSYIHIRKGDVEDVKDFHFEIMDWYSKHLDL